MAEDCRSSHTDGIGGSRLFGGFAIHDHVGLEKATAEVDMTLLELLEDSAEDAVSDGGALFDRIITILEDVGFDNWNDASELTFFGKVSEKLSVALDSDEARLIFGNMKLSAPFGKAEMVIIGGASVIVDIANASSIWLASLDNFGETLIKLEARNNTMISEIIGHVLAMFDGLFGAGGAKNYGADVFIEIR